MKIDPKAHNKAAWDREVEKKNPWTLPVEREVIERARRGAWSVVLTPTRPVPRAWFPPFPCDVLCLASGGGQQGPILAAAGARVTVLDQSPRQLEQDRYVAERDNLPLRLEEGDMEDLSRFEEASFDLIFHPVSNLFTPDVRRVWRECFRVLRPGGTLLAGMVNPDAYLFDRADEERGVLRIRHKVPYSDLDLPEEERALRPDEPIEFGHSLTDQLGGQMDAGFHLVGLYEDTFGGESPLDQHLRVFLATRAIKPA